MDARAFVTGLFSADGAAFARLDAAGWAGAHAAACALDAEALLAARLRAFGVAAPPAIAAAIDHAYKNNVVHALAAARELDEILALFAAQRIDAAPLKGGALMRLGVHRDLGGRYMHDLDLLVRPRDRAAIRALLDARGYGEAPDGESPKHLPPLRRGRVYVELHEFAYWEANGARVDLAAWRASSVETGGSGELARVAAHLLHHLFRSSVNEPLLALKTAWDLREIAGFAKDLAEIERAAARAGLARELAALLALGGDGDPGRREPALALCAPIDAAELRRRVFRFHVASLARAPLWYRAIHARAMFAPSRRAMEKLHGGPLEGPALARAYLVRPIALAAKTARAIVDALRSRAPR